MPCRCPFKPSGWAKTWMIMRLTTILIIISTMVANARSYAQKVSLSFKKAPLENVLNEIGQQTGYSFLWDQQAIKKMPPIDVSVHNTDIKDALMISLKGLPLTCEIHGLVVYIKEKPKDGNVTFPNGLMPMIIPQPVIITGRVTDSTGSPLSGVSVFLKGTKTGTITDGHGDYTLTLPESRGILIFSYVGYDSKEITVSNATVVDVRLNPVASSLNQIVVVGYGSQKRTYVTGSIASANLDVVRDAPNTNIAQSLQGNIPGLNVGPVTSAGSTPTITVRGQNTLNGNTNVLIILDGIQYNNSLSSINPDDIASIDLLKDASSTAVYGAQAANGVLLITSRKGAISPKPRINLNTSYTTQTPSGHIRPYNRQEYLDKIRDLYWDSAYLAPDYTKLNPNFDIAKFVDLTMRDGTGILPNDFNWYNAGTKTGLIQDNQLSISGASNKVNYLISGAYTNQKGFIINDLFKRKSLRTNVETQVTNWLKVGLQSFASFVNQDGAEPTLKALFQMSPLQTPYNADGSLNPYPFNSVDPNPFLTYDVSDYERHNYLFANIYTEVKVPFINGLTYRLNFGNNGREDLHYYASKYAGGLTGEAYKQSENYYDYTLDNIFTYTKSYKRHNLTATAVYGAIKRRDESTNATGTGFTNLALGYNSLELATTQQISSDGWQETLNYYMGRINYSFADKYLLTATIRRDGYSGFAANHKWGTFPSVSTGWIISNESFMQKIKAINYLKLRAGYGIAGNQTQRYYSLDQLTQQAAYVFGDGGSTVIGQYISTLPNNDLKWERTSEINIGLDVNVINDRITGAFDYYSRHTNDLLFPVQIPNITGFSTINSNVGEIGNKGFEISVTSKNLAEKNLKWTTTFNFSRNINKILKLLGGGDLVASNLFIGKPITAIYGYQTAGIYQLNDNIPAGYFPGSYRVVDHNKDGVVNSNDRYVLGSQDPAYRFSVLNSFQYKGFTFTFLLNSIQGGKNGYLGSNSPSITLSDVNVRNGGIAGVKYWTPADPTSTYASSPGAAPTISPSIYYSRSFVRLQDVSLSYKLSSTFIQKLHMQNLSLYVSGKNLITWTKWKGWDPEVTNGGLDPNGRPLLMGYSFGINATF